MQRNHDGSYVRFALAESLLHRGSLLGMRLPAKVETMEVVQVVVMALALSLLATIYPSWRAARLDPVEALRYE